MEVLLKQRIIGLVGVAVVMAAVLAGGVMSSPSRANAAYGGYITPAQKCAFMQAYDAANHETFSLSHWRGSQWSDVTVCP